ncbi:hypothetical protein [Tateyamaria sp. SN3-11]|uniref:hypothetical protein n=1 Tax=Tateyamaria sp. SN3-11 TaxID=3092147 RepID=UPI0039E9C01D
MGGLPLVMSPEAKDRQFAAPNLKRCTDFLGAGLDAPDFRAVCVQYGRNDRFADLGE